MVAKVQNSRIKPDWLKIRIANIGEFNKVNKTIKNNGLHTICTSGKCPNARECWGEGTATFMILGDICTRACGFCSVKTGKPNPVDLMEPTRVAESVKTMNLKHAVITSVDRDDLADGGAEVWAATIRKIRELNPGITMETLIPDFLAKYENLEIVLKEKPEVISHNMETVRRLTGKIRSRARYDRSLQVLKWINEYGIRSKSGIMLGLGETEAEILETMDDLRKVNCEVMTIGQYLQPTKKHLEVQEYIKPEVFKKYEEMGLEKGFRFVESGPLVRSSYHAARHVK
jgi:lipoic acid synthetase